MRYKYLLTKITGEKPEDLEKRFDMHGEAGQKFIGFYNYLDPIYGSLVYAIFEKEKPDREPNLDFLFR